MITRRGGQGCTHERVDGGLLSANRRALSVDLRAGRTSHMNVGRALG